MVSSRRKRLAEALPYGFPSIQVVSPQPTPVNVQHVESEPRLLLSRPGLNEARSRTRRNFLSPAIVLEPRTVETCHLCSRYLHRAPVPVCCRGPPGCFCSGKPNRSHRARSRSVVPPPRDRSRPLLELEKCHLSACVAAALKFRVGWRTARLWLTTVSGTLSEISGSRPCLRHSHAPMLVCLQRLLRKILHRVHLSRLRPRTSTVPRRTLSTST